MRPRPPYYMTTPERAVGDVKAMLLAIEEREPGILKYPEFTQIQRAIHLEQLTLLKLPNDTKFLRNRRETDMARLARATRAHFDPTSLIDARSLPFDYRSVDDYWEMSMRIAQRPELNALSLKELFEFAVRRKRGEGPKAVRRVLLFDEADQSQFSK